MELSWLYTLCQCIVSAAVIGVSVRLCIAVSASKSLLQDRPETRSVSYCLLLCLGWVGVLGGALGIPVTVFLNLRTRQCLYTCITLVCCPLLVRQFTMCLLVMLTLNSHMQHHLANKYHTVMTHRRALCAVLLCWVGSILSSFAQFISTDGLTTWINRQNPGTSGLEVDGNLTTPSPHIPATPQYQPEREVIGRFLPYGGFLSKFYMEDMHNLTYSEIHRSHMGVCAPDTLLSPEYLVYVQGMTVFMLPLLCLVAVYLDLLCRKAHKGPFSHADLFEHDSRVRSLALSLCLLVLLSMPFHILHTLLLFSPSTKLPIWAHASATFLFQLYSLVPQLLFTPPRKKVSERQASFPLSVPHLPAIGKRLPKAVCEAVHVAPWSSDKHSVKAKVCQ